MTDSTNQDASLALYSFLCQNIVGTEDHVKTIRMMNTVRDNLRTTQDCAVITSGSIGEGIMMQGSDLDIMGVMKKIEVREDANIRQNHDIMYLTLETVDTQPGFTTLRLVHSDYQKAPAFCEMIGEKYYFSNSKFKHYFLNSYLSTVHGPCISDKVGFFDMAYSLHSKLWITQATQWITRSTYSWPGPDVKRSIVKHGVLFVPVGVKGSTNEELEWRLSFSVAEKLLIYTFTHTQLLCYALLKILLKDIIALGINGTDILCSYFMKTILFWISEELPTSIWIPQNLISCFMKCFRRLIYCVEFSICPNYFIPESNLFENRIKEYAKEILLDKLYILKKYGWQCILLSEQISNFFVSHISKEPIQSYVYNIKQLLSEVMNLADNMRVTYNLPFENVIHRVLSSKSFKIKYMYTYYMTKRCNKSVQLLPYENICGNKSTFKQYKSYISSLLMLTRHDALSGWLLLASFFYMRKQFNITLAILQYALSKCTPDSFYRSMKFKHINYQSVYLPLFTKMPFVQMVKFLVIDIIDFIKDSMLIPDELEMEVETKPLSIPPVVYTHFLCFLCHYHGNDTSQCWDSLRDLILTVHENYFVANTFQQAISYNILGIAFQLIGETETAVEAFIESIETYPNRDQNFAYQRLSLMGICDYDNIN